MYFLCLKGFPEYFTLLGCKCLYPNVQDIRLQCEDIWQSSTCFHLLVGTNAMSFSSWCLLFSLSSRGRGLGLRTVAIRGQPPWMSCPSLEVKQECQEVFHENGIVKQHVNATSKRLDGTPSSLQILLRIIMRGLCFRIRSILLWHRSNFFV